ncbi:MAG TPA: 6-phosphofructokinase [Tepidisphaeraceae bacterium]|nr:6-phosphofructokinase [Tepidisphaeraceae bacterium]
MATQPTGNAVIGQSGGPTAVINQSLVGVIEELRKTNHVNRLLGARHGVRGIVDERFIELNDVPDELLARIAKTPAAALGSTRDKPDQTYCERIFRSFAKNDVRYFFYIGGNDSADTARIVNDLAKAEGYPLQTFHIPKTIDNDLRVHDHTPGYGSAARWVACAIRGDNFDNKSLPGIKVDIIMGRHAGFLTAASVLARHRDDDGPHLIYVPEAPVSEDKFLADVDAMYKKHGRCLIACSEGITAPDGRTWFEKRAEAHERDSHGNLQLSGSGELGDYMAELIKSRLGTKLRIRADTFGYVQRSFPLQSETDAQEARLVGQVAARESREPGSSGSVAMRRVGSGDYQIETFLTPLHTVAKETKHMEDRYIENGNNITQAFIDYASPIVGKLPEVGTFDELTR